MRSGLRGFLLPVATLALASLALIARFVRVCVAAALADPAALAGRARGEAAVRGGPARPPPLGGARSPRWAPRSCPSVVSGSILVERVFSLPGAGGLLAEAVFARDLPTVLALTLLSAWAVVAASLVADLVAAALDPRIAREVEVAVPGSGGVTAAGRRSAARGSLRALSAGGASGAAPGAREALDIRPRRARRS